jgi:hypothetical protein
MCLCAYLAHIPGDSVPYYKGLNFTDVICTLQFKAYYLSIFKLLIQNN